MLTRSNWFTELRSNRYHYASRFARHLPVFFVQADLPWFGFEEEKTELSGVTVWHVPQLFGWRQSEVIAAAIERRGICRPILWSYEHRFLDLVARSEAAAKVVHATEDYFSDDFNRGNDPDQIRALLGCCDLLVAVSDGVLERYRTRGRYRGRALVLTNGCDASFWRQGPQRASRQRVAIYQGGISSKIDFRLLEEVVERMPEWEFRFCGRTFAGDREGRAGFAHLRRRSNVRYVGDLRVEELRDELHQATVGLVPLVQNDTIVNRTFSLKGFEYVACGLPVVSVPMRAFQPFGDLFHFASDADGFIAALPMAAASRQDADALATRAAAASRMDYGVRFSELWETLNSTGFDSGGAIWSLGPRGGARSLRHALADHGLAAVGHLPRGARGPVVRVARAVASRARRLLRLFSD